MEFARDWADYRPTMDSMKFLAFRLVMAVSALSKSFGFAETRTALRAGENPLFTRGEPKHAGEDLVTRKP